MPRTRLVFLSRVCDVRPGAMDPTCRRKPETTKWRQKNKSGALAPTQKPDAKDPTYFFKSGGRGPDLFRPDLNKSGPWHPRNKSGPGHLCHQTSSRVLGISRVSRTRLVLARLKLSRVLGIRPGTSRVLDISSQCAAWHGNAYRSGLVWQLGLVPDLFCAKIRTCFVRRSGLVLRTYDGRGS